MSIQETSLVFAALADPTRRRIVELLSDGRKLRVSDLAIDLAITRQGIAKHLDVLGAAGLTSTDRRGRERLTTMNDEAFEPIKDWLSDHDRFWKDRLQALKQEVERRTKP